MTDGVRIEAVVFDIGNVLLDWNPDHLYRQLIPDEPARRHFLAEVCNTDWNRRQDGGRPWADGIAEKIASHPGHADLIRAFRDRWHEMVRGPIPGSVAILEALKARRMPVYAITNFAADTFAECCDRFTFLNLFEGVIVSGREGVLKPDRAIFDLLIERYDVSPQDTLFIDDVAENTAAASVSGFQIHLFRDAGSLHEALCMAGVMS